MSQHATNGYHYTECGLPDVWIEGCHVEDDAGEETIRIPKVRSLHRLISKGIVSSAGTLTGPELRYLRTEMGLTQTQLGELVHRGALDRLALGTRREHTGWCHRGIHSNLGLPQVGIGKL